MKNFYVRNEDAELGRVSRVEFMEEVLWIWGYVNGNQVTRFNHLGDYDADKEIATQNPILLVPSDSAAKAMEGENGLGFEVHCPVETSSLEGVVFDAMGMESCSMVVSMYSSLTSTDPSL